MTTYNFVYQIFVWPCNQKHGWQPSFSRNFCFFFKKLIPSGISINNKHLLILDGWIPCHLRGNWINKIIWARYGDFTFAYISCTLAFICGLLHSFETIFRRKKYTIMVIRNYIEPYEITLARWVNKAINQTFIRKKSY
jgi:hypothetical protein